MDTFELLPVLAAGDLSTTSAPELVAAIYRSRATGTLSLEGENKEELRLFFKLGNSCGVARPTGFRTLIDVLLSLKLLSSEQADRAASQSSASGKKVGEVLVEMRLLTPEQVLQGLAAQHRENLKMVLNRNVGRYEWRGWEPPPHWALEVTVDPTRAILEALASPQLAGRRAAVLRWLGDAQVRASVDFAELAHKADLIVGDRRAAESFESPISPESFHAASGLQRPRAEALLATLLLVGAVEPVPPEASQPLDASLFEPDPDEPHDEGGPHDAGATPLDAGAAPLDSIFAPPAAPPLPSLEPLEAQPAVEPEAAPEPAIEEPHDLALQAAADAEDSAEILPDSDEIRSVEPEPDDEPDLGAELAAELEAAKAASAAEASQRAPLQPPAPLDASELFGDPGSVGYEPDPLEMAAESAGGPEQIVSELPPLESLADSVHSEKVPSREVELPPIEAAPADEQIQLVEPPSLQKRSGDPFGGTKARSGADFLLDGAADDSLPGLELDSLTPPSKPPPQASNDDVRKKLRSKGMRNMGWSSGPIALESEAPGQAMADELKSELQPAPLTDEEKCFLEDVRARVKIAPKQDAYSRLGLTQAATQDQIRSAYLSMVKKFHPDRAQASAGMRLAANDLDALFGMLREAYERIGSPEARAAYDASGKKPAAPGKGASRTEDAKLSLKKGEVYLKKRDYENALREFRRAVELDPTADSLTGLAWGIANDKGQGGAGREEALKLVQKAITLDKRSPRAHYVAGVLLRTTRPEQALKHFQICVDLDPKNTDAALELRLLERRAQAAKPITGPLGRIFKRDGK